jgi:hypothetical protein
LVFDHLGSERSYDHPQLCWLEEARRSCPAQ